TPVEQSVTLLSQMFEGGVHAMVAVHDWQPPPWQTRFVPQVRPSGAGVNWSMQLGWPCVQAILPALHGFAGGAGVQSAPAEHGSHVPSLQKRSVPQDVPFGTLPAAMQTGTPDEQSYCFLRHEPAGVQSSFAGHVLHAPWWQTCCPAGPQGFPSAT